SFELGGKRTSLLAHQTPLSRRGFSPKSVSGISRPLHFVEAIDRDTFFGKVSMSKVITALLQIAVERGAAFDSSKVTDTESLKAELERMLQR
ncbi:hypothetical protein Q8W87_31290, partial [Pseudomonas aeruginosa]|uniref:hypothetical protein n=1 Tax=Pseudomonas aeruginosa TaxID=287 RepID=UPI0028FDF168